MKRTNNDKARGIRLRAVVAYPAVSVALVVALALVLNPLGTSQVMALDVTPTPTETTVPTATDTASPTATDTASPTATDTASPTATDTASPTATDTASPSATDTSGLAAAASTTPTPSPAPIPSLDSVVGPAPAVLAPGGISVDHFVLARVEGPGIPAAYLPVDGTVLDASQFQTFRVRFQMRNAGTAPITVIPQLEYHPSGGVGYVAVPEKPELGSPLHTSREWVAGSNGGTIQGPAEEDISVAALRTVGELGDTAVAGHHSMSANPDKPIILDPASYTEQEFTVALSVDAQYQTGYELRITDDGTALAGTDVTSISLGPTPTSQNSLGQRQGAVVAGPSVMSPSGAAYPLLSAPSTVADSSPATVPAVSPSSIALYPLASGSLSTAVVGPDIPVIESSNTHGQCAACHRGHTAKAPDLTKESNQSTLCFSCHDAAGAAAGTGAKDVKSQYTLQPPVNDPEKREYYSHDAISSTPSTTRPSQCADCHNSHRAEDTDSTQASDGTGWTASGRMAGISGVSVENDPTPGSSPTYTPLDGIDKPVTREYQLCFKCHSGATTLTSNEGLAPSQYALDKGVEFNPANASFHPVEAAGTNGTDKMKASLAGSSPYKLWNFNIGSTVRCLNCHASGATPEPNTDTTATQPPAAGGDLAPHTSSNRGILLRNYLDRELKPRVDTTKVKAAYSAGDFALCYVCHGEEPFANAASPDNSTATNFNLHGQHLTGLIGKGDGATSIDKAGDGQGNATCAECHFRIHSTTNEVGNAGGSRLVNFAPNVQPVATGRAILFSPLSDSARGSCTLTCHGYTHDALKY